MSSNDDKTAQAVNDLLQRGSEHQQEQAQIASGVKAAGLEATLADVEAVLQALILASTHLYKLRGTTAAGLIENSIDLRARLLLIGGHMRMLELATQGMISDVYLHDPEAPGADVREHKAHILAMAHQYCICHQCTEARIRGQAPPQHALGVVGSGMSGDGA